ncbi:MAG TPA: TraR/DksA C4-type zinc finger protein [Acidimicrobiia bacterium]|nr:TraR/DksA C4-type zinc finger protein [Acidimicrobiia bacterium]
MTTFDTTSAKVALTEERERIVHQMIELGVTETGELTGDVDYGDGFADAAAATAERTEVLVVVESLKSQLTEIDAALARIEKGTYGVCAQCGIDIPADRLEFRPSSIYCVDCKSSR